MINFKSGLMLCILSISMIFSGNTALAYTKANQLSGTPEIEKPDIPPPGVADVSGRHSPARTPGSVPDSTVWFWTRDFRTRNVVRIKANLIVYDENTVFYLEDGRFVDPDVANGMLEEISEKILPEVRRFFGREPYPGISGDGRITIFIYDIQDNYDTTGLYYAGYFSAEDLYPQSVAKYSNEREMLYIDFWPGLIDGSLNDIYGVIAHEYQHLVHFYADNDEVKWVDEGCANLSTYICGYGEPYQHTRAFQAASDTSLIEWDGTLEDYGASFLFIKYIYEKYDKATSLIKRIIAESRNCRSGLEAALGEKSFDGIFADWVTANIIDAYADEDLYQYNDMDIKCSPKASVLSWPWPIREETLNPYGTHYYRLTKGEGNNITILVDTFDHRPVLLQLMAYTGNQAELISRETIVLSRQAKLDISELDLSWDWCLISLSSASDLNARYTIQGVMDGPLIRLVPNPVIPANVVVIVKAENIESATFIHENFPSKVLSLSLREVRPGIFLGSFDPDESGHYMVTVTGKGPEGQEGRSRAKAVITSVVPGLYMKWGVN